MRGCDCHSCKARRDRLFWAIIDRTWDEDEQVGLYVRAALSLPHAEPTAGGRGTA